MEALIALGIIAIGLTNFLWLRAYREREADYNGERRELLTRILHPELVPVESSDLPDDSELLTADPNDEYSQVGMVEGGEQLNGDRD